MSLELKETDKQKVGFFRFNQLNGKYLITNDIGEWSFLTPRDFDSFLYGKIKQTSRDKYSELQSKGFIRDMLDFDELSQRYVRKNSFLGQSTLLHIVVVTLRCDHKCLYCQAGSQPLNAKYLDMDIATAQKVVDRIFESPNENINIEFQGGEPLANFATVKFIVECAREKNKIAKKKLMIFLVSNLTFMTEKRLDFFVKNNVSICTSLDGPEIMHNRNRICKGNSYKNTLKWINKIRKRIAKSKIYKYKVNALTTITKISLSDPKGIVDEFIDLGLEGVHLRPVNPFGMNKEIWNKINFSAEDFSNFYKKALDYIIELNLKGKKFYEKTAKIFLTKILTGKDPNFLDLRSPCGAGIGQIAYNFNGDVYACDEARMLSRVDDNSFRLGNVEKDTFQNLIHNDVVKVLCSASCMDGLPVCSECVYKPYCGVCPIYNYVVEGNIFSTSYHNERCKINMFIFDYLFERLQNPQIKKVFNSWVLLPGRF